MNWNYPTREEDIVFKEYGRHIQKLVTQCKAIPDRDKRTATAQGIMNIMVMLNPQIKSEENYRQKIYDHLQVMANFELDVDSPYPMPSKEEFFKKPKPVPYPQAKIRFAHYGKYVEILIKKAIECEEEEKKKVLTNIIGNYMKLVFRSFNRDGVGDEQIVEDMLLLSDGQLSIEENANFDLLGKAPRFQPVAKKQKNKPNYSNNRQPFRHQKKKRK